MTDTLTGQKMAKTNVLAIASPGSRALKNAKYENYCRLRASAQPRIPAYREVGWHSKRDDDAYANACRLERRSEIRDRIAYLTRQAEELIAEKRQRIEEQLWAVLGANIGDYFEAYEAVKRDHTGQPERETIQTKTGEISALSTERRVRPKLLVDLPPAVRKQIEEVTVDSRGRLIPRLYSKMQASKELRSMLNLNAKSDAADVTKLSDEELITTLAAQARELGVDIKLDYTFHLPKKDEGDSG
jgi:hypothetical protein